MKIVLGSQSPRRLEILRSVVPKRFVVEALPTGLDEKAIPRPVSPAGITLKFAIRKSVALQQLVHEPAILVTADTVTVFCDQVREKPEHPDQARQWLDSYNDAPVQVVTAVVIFDNRSRHDEAIVDSATVRFKGLTAQRIDAILADGTAMGCAGGIMVEHPLFQPLVDRIFGDPQTVQGLPGRLVEVALRSLYA
ncbi:MAG TPA: Maf family protein [Candidatus Paceibacterota bacterium]|nr:Maf family protein [Candidatus Paceibacterota bacterium]